MTQKDTKYYLILGLLGLMSLATPNILWAQETLLPRHEVLIGAGVPAPLDIHGYDPSEADSSVDFIGHAFLGYRWRPVRAWNWLGVGGQVSGAYMSGRVGEIPGEITWWTLSPYIVASFTPLTDWPELALEAGGGPALLRHTVYVDSDINKLGHSLGGQFFVSFGWLFHDHMRLMVRVGLDIYAQPYDEPTWYNQKLGRTRFASFDLNFAVGWGD